MSDGRYVFTYQVYNRPCTTPKARLCVIGSTCKMITIVVMSDACAQFVVVPLFYVCACMVLCCPLCSLCPLLSCFFHVFMILCTYGRVHEFLRIYIHDVHNGVIYEYSYIYSLFWLLLSFHTFGACFRLLFTGGHT